MSQSTGVFESSRGPSSEDDFDLGAFVRLLWRFKLGVGLAAIAGGALALAFSLSGSRMYESDVALIVQNRPDARIQGVANLKPFIDNHVLADAVIKELGLNKPPYSLSPTNLFKSAVTLEETRNSSVLVVKAQLTDPLLATRLVNRIAELAVERSTRLLQDTTERQAERVREDLVRQKNEARIRMEEADKELERFRDRSQIELLRKDADVALDLRGELVKLSIALEVETARLQKAEQQLAARTRIETFKRSILPDPVLGELARYQSNGGDIRQLGVEDEAPNRVYDQLDAETTGSRTKIAALTTEKSHLLNQARVGGRQFAELTRLYAAESELSRLQTIRGLAHEVYVRVASAYENARLPVPGETSPLQIINAGIPPDRPLPRNAARNALLGAVAGLLLGLAVVFVRGAFLEPVRGARA